MPTQLSRTGPTMHRHRAAATHRALAFLARAQAHDRRCLLLDHNCADYLLSLVRSLFTSHNSFAPAAGTPEFKVQDSDINTGDDDWKPNW